jgi:hypothetical protein
MQSPITLITAAQRCQSSELEICNKIRYGVKFQYLSKKRGGGRDAPVREHLDMDERQRISISLIEGPMKARKERDAD